MHVRTLAVALAAAPLLALLPASPALAESADCVGAAPVQPTCSATGFLGGDPSQLVIMCGPGVMLSGKLTARLVTSTATLTATAMFVNGTIASKQVTQSGSFQPYQAFTLYGSTTAAAGAFYVSVDSP